MSALFFVLGIPLLGGITLALFGHRDRAMELNVAFSTGTFLAACVLTAQVIAGGPLFAWDREFFSRARQVGAWAALIDEVATAAGEPLTTR